MDLLSLSACSGKRIHLGVTGSIAAYKGLDLLRLYVKTGLGVGATLTSAASEFVTDLSFTSLGADPVYGSLFTNQEHPYGHLEPGQVAKALVIAPATANFLAKLANGLADDMLSTQALSFSGPLIVAPCMNPRMWDHAATRANWHSLVSRGVIGIPPCTGDVACGDTGQGRLAELDEIYLKTLQAVLPNNLAGQKILITLGPTREHFDRVRFWSNPSSGRMGWSLAIAAWLRGADVCVVHGPVDLSFPSGMATVPVATAREMYTACMDQWPAMDMACCTAAVADFSPVPYDGGGKLKKDQCPDGLRVPFTRNPDILKTMGDDKRPDQRLIGFAAEAGADIQKTAQAKLASKNLDLIVANRIDLDQGGFFRRNNSVLIIDGHGNMDHLNDLPKTEIAWRIWDWL
ncbi:bifunctional phosphopantothenoylcysteine decarboxylase/phosphopantothenate--cysteine ligase CoaBC [Desulfoplanes sp.]